MRPSGQKEAALSLGAANCETAATFDGFWEHMQTRKRPPRPWGLRTERLSPRSWAPGRPSGVMPYANQNEASPSLGAANCQAVATFVAPSSLLLCQIVVAFLPMI